jgi:glutathione S-transferase
MAITLYGVVGSRALRCLWMLEELGLPYQHVKTDFRGGGTRTPEHLKINPNGHIPVLQEDGLTLFESMAINLYLAMKHNRGLWPASVEDQARAIQWSFWGMTEVEPHLLQVLINRSMLPPDRRDEARAQKALDTLQTPFRILDDVLAGRETLVGNAFSVADLNVAAILSWIRGAKVEVSAFSHLERWLMASLSRPAFKAAAAKK